MKYSCFLLLLQLSQSHGHSVAGMIMSMKNSSDNIGIKTANFKLEAQCLYRLWLRVLPH
jgi:hypothetical protein